MNKTDEMYLLAEFERICPFVVKIILAQIPKAHIKNAKNANLIFKNSFKIIYFINISQQDLKIVLQSLNLAFLLPNLKHFEFQKNHKFSWNFSNLSHW